MTKQKNNIKRKGILRIASTEKISGTCINGLYYVSTIERFDEKKLREALSEINGIVPVFDILGLNQIYRPLLPGKEAYSQFTDAGRFLQRETQLKEFIADLKNRVAVYHFHTRYPLTNVNGIGRSSIGFFDERTQGSRFWTPCSRFLQIKDYTANSDAVKLGINTQDISELGRHGKGLSQKVEITRDSGKISYRSIAQSQ